MPHPTDREWGILITAQLIVDQWLCNPRRPSFARLLTTAERRHLRSLELTERERLLFRRVATAIRTGRGHLEANPAPLLAILRAGG